MAFQLPPLPYAQEALEPHISAQTLEFHYDKHHTGYVNKLNAAVTGTDLENDSLENVIKKVADDDTKKGIFNNAAQVWNHTFYWDGMKKDGGGEPPLAVLEKINESFGGLDNFRDEFKQAAVTQFGSGWAWLVLEDGKLKVVNTGNADNPIVRGQKPILTIDVWEHAYYLDYQNRRPDYIDMFVGELINWEFVKKNLEG